MITILKHTQCVFFAFFFLALLSHDVIAANQKDQQKVQSTQAQSHNSTKNQEDEQRESENRLMYRPPQRGAPMGRLAGGTRGPADEIPFICALVPEHVGLTQMSQPNLYWYISEPSPHEVVLTVNSDETVLPLLETALVRPKEAGVQTIKLSDFDISLEKEHIYTWFVALVPDPKNRSKDILTRGGIRLASLSEDVRNSLRVQSAEEQAIIYAEQGLWYDALQALMNLVQETSGDTFAVQQAEKLLQQAKIPESVTID